MNNTVTAAEIKRRGMAVTEEGLRRCPVHIVKTEIDASLAEEHTW
jgi:hypothetical protein